MIKYLPSHEYVRVDGNYGYIGISPYAAKQLGNIVYVDMPEVDDEVEAGEDFGAIESVKAASDLFAPVSGTVVEVNEKLADNPGLVGQDPMENWIIKVEMSNPGDLEKLLTPEQYEELCANEEH
ncbi:MAG: glycine cleavage system protein GcvH [Muribaculaceae bacterium]|nr:glycine cleavage system protein GcvH [Bacteroidales bacterium]MDD6722482.1 glycine cleavage system protein GcvH [Bacteroidales bacterium]